MPGIIYLIGCDGPERYVGSTILPLMERWSLHRRKHNHCRSKQILDKYGSESCWIEVLEEVADDTLLEERERHWIENTSGCVNKKLPGRTAEEYRATHKEEASARSHTSYLRNKDKVCERSKLRYASLTPEEREARRVKNTEAARRRRAQN